MNETAVIAIISLVLGYFASFLTGYFLCKGRGSRLADDNKLCGELQDTTEQCQERAVSIDSRIGEIIENTGVIEDIIGKYKCKIGEDKEME